MLDIRLLRENPAEIKTRLACRGDGYGELVDEVLACDVARRQAETALQQLNADRKRISKEIGLLRAKGESTDRLENEVKGFAAETDRLNTAAASHDEQQRNLLLQIPNLPHANAPEGHAAEDNPVVRLWGEKPAIAEPVCHTAIIEQLQLMDLTRAVKISGSGFTCFTGDGARLERALLNFLLDLHTRAHGYTEISPPFLIKRDCMTGTGQLPKFEHDMYAVTDSDLFLAPTAEVPLTNLYRDEILARADLPIQLASYTPCFRREAGSAGKDNRGIIRMHQFDKVELVKICPPETAEAELESLTGHAEAVLQLLGLHYRVIELCTGDLGFSSAKTYDIEVWAPGQNAYLEVSSCSHFGDYQARRMNLRFKDEDGKNKHCHTINGSGTALARLYVALIETYFRDGQIHLPAPLHPYFGGSTLG